MKMYEWFYSCKKNFRLFLRRIYVSKKSDRERSLTRPLRESEVNTKGRPRRSCIQNILIVATIIVCYFFFLPRPSTPNMAATYSENSIETSVVFNPRQVQRVHIPKEAKVEFARKWLSKNTPEIIDTVTEADLVTFSPTRSFAEQAKNVPGDVIFIDDSKTSSTTPKSTTPEIPKCMTRVSPEMLTVVTSPIKVSLENIYPMVQKGGYYKPSHCVASHKVAILVPYRNRTRNLSNFLYNMHPFLMTQDLEYRIFVIEQYGNHKFNKGRLFNAGFKEMLKHGWWRCVVLHDVDLLPLDQRILYTCPRFPRHMSSYVIDKWSGRNTSSPILFGGVTAMAVKHYTKANGHSNMYWGWGGEDYDMFWRIKTAMIPIVRYNKTIARYIALPHEKERPNPLRYSLIHSAIGRWQAEGLNTVEYKVVSTTLHHLFTHILVDVQPWGDTKELSSGLKISKQLKPKEELPRLKEVVKHRRRDPPPSPVNPPTNTMYRPNTVIISPPSPLSQPVLAISPPLKMDNIMG